MDISLGTKRWTSKRRNDFQDKPVFFFFKIKSKEKIWLGNLPYYFKAALKKKPIKNKYGISRRNTFFWSSKMKYYWTHIFGSPLSLLLAIEGFSRYILQPSHSLSIFWDLVFLLFHPLFKLLFSFFVAFSTTLQPIYFRPNCIV